MTLSPRHSSILQMVNTGILLAMFNYVVQIEHRLTVLETEHRNILSQPQFAVPTRPRVTP